MDAFERVLRALCVTVGIDEVEAVIASSEIVIDGLALQFIAPQEEGATMVIFADLGVPEEMRRADVHRLLLEGNHLWQGTGGGVLGVHPATGVVGLSAGVGLAGLEGGDLAELVARFVTVAEYWQGVVRQPLGGDAPEGGMAPDAFFVRG